MKTKNSQIIVLSVAVEQKERRIKKLSRSPLVPDALSFTLPWPPSVNHCWKPRRGGGMYLSEEGRRFKEAAQEIAWAAAQWSHWQSPEKPKRGKAPVLLVVELAYFSPDWRQDCDNGMKLALDAISAALGYNDRYFLPRAVARTVDAENPRIEVRVYAISR